VAGGEKEKGPEREGNKVFWVLSQAPQFAIALHLTLLDGQQDPGALNLEHREITAVIVFSVIRCNYCET
jgi:hypothetical protein